MASRGEGGRAGRVGWGILATGRIAQQFTRDLLQHGHRVAAVGSRTTEAAEQFAHQFGIPRAHGSYQALVQDPDVDVVYVATPHSAHAQNALAALANGKHVLVEKAFTATAREAREVVAEAKARRLLVMEAMWTRFLPHMSFVRSVVRDGRLGQVRWVHADHTQLLSEDPVHRLNNLSLAGGALLDLGVYPLSFAHDLLGAPEEVNGHGALRETGADASVATVLRHAGGAVSTSYSASDSRGPNTAVVLGTDGRIDIDAVWYRPTTVTVRDAAGNVLDRFDEPVTGRGMQFQAAEVERLLAAGKTASAVMPPEGSIAVMETMDRLRAQLGVRYPGEPG